MLLAAPSTPLPVLPHPVLDGSMVHESEAMLAKCVVNCERYDYHIPVLSSPDQSAQYA